MPNSDIQIEQYNIACVSFSHDLCEKKVLRPRLLLLISNKSMDRVYKQIRNASTIIKNHITVNKSVFKVDLSCIITGFESQYLCRLRVLQCRSWVFGADFVRRAKLRIDLLLKLHKMLGALHLLY